MTHFADLEPCTYFGDVAGSVLLAVEWLERGCPYARGVVPAEPLRCFFVCPELILHYLNVHEYQPPPSFIAAVLSCPPTDSPEYRARFVALGGASVIRAARSSSRA